MKKHKRLRGYISNYEKLLMTTSYAIVEVCTKKSNSSPFIESPNHQGWKGPPRSSSPTILLSPIILTKPCPSTQHLNVP